MKLAGAIALVIVLVGCPTPVTPPAPAPGELDGGRAVGCVSACAHLRELGCEAGQPTPGGATCETVCSNANYSVGSPTEAHWATSCIAHASSCAAADDCRNP